MGQQPDACTWLLPGEPTASCLPTELMGTIRETEAWAPVRRCVTVDVSSWKQLAPMRQAGWSHLRWLPRLLPGRQEGMEMPSKVISSLESQLSGWLGKKGQSKVDAASGCSFGDSAKSIGGRACPGCTADVQLAASASPLPDTC